MAARKPAFADPYIRKTLMNAFMLGFSKAAAAHAIGVEYETLRVWFKRGRAAKSGQYKEFFEEAQQSITKGMMRRVARIDKAAEENWQADAWMLERMHPDLFGRPSTRVEVNDPGKDEDGENTKQSQVVVYIPDNGRD